MRITFHTNRFFCCAVIIVTAFFMMGSHSSWAKGVIDFGPHETKIDGSIPYSVIGKYRATFRAFKGRIILDDQLKEIQSVYLDIKVGSITSNCSWCDHVVCSHRLLNTVKYPNIIFKSIGVTRDGEEYRVKGVLAMHGIKRVLSFPFHARIIDDENGRGKVLDIQGAWLINRKDFDIYWNRLLDRGGILVGDNITVKWGIKTRIKREGL